MNRSAMEEVGKIKEVKMTGEAEECFEQWRKAWDRVISNDLPNVEEWLYDAEESVDKFRFSQAKEIFVKIEEGLKACETKIQKHVDQMQKVIESEEKNREEIQTIVETYKQLKKELLAHQHAFGKASVQLEKVIQAIKADIEKFELETEKGNYLTAREIVEALKNEINTLQNKMEHIPILLNDCVHIIPNQLKELKQGINDMTEEGYRLEHLGIEKELADIESQIKVYIEFLEAAEVKEVLAGLPEIKENLESIYQLLEEEVKAKQYVLTNRKKAEETLNKIDQTNAELTKEVEIVKISYHLSETDEKLLEQINKKIVTLKQSIKLLLDEKSISQSAYSIVKEKLETLLTELEEVETNQQLIEETLQELRKDEIEAREKIQTLKNKSKKQHG